MTSTLNPACHPITTSLEDGAVSRERVGLAKETGLAVATTASAVRRDLDAGDVHRVRVLR